MITVAAASGSCGSAAANRAASDPSDASGTALDASGTALDASGIPLTDAAGHAGDGGDAQPPPTPTVGTCDGLAAVNTFEDITPPGVDLSGSGITAVLPDPVHAGTVFAGTDHSGLFESTDCGSTWKKVNTGMNGAILDSGTLWSMAIDPVYPNIIYAGSLYGSSASLFQSVNGGVDWQNLFPSGGNVATAVPGGPFFQDMAIDPLDHTHLIVTFHINCTGPAGPGCLAETNDSGATWTLLPGPTSSWSEGAGPVILGGMAWLVTTTEGGLYYTDNGGGTWTMVGPGGNLQVYQASTGTYYLGSYYGLEQSTNEGATWTAITGAPNGVFGLIGDGKRMFASERTPDANMQPYFTSSESDGNTWTALASPNMASGAHGLAYDSAHHLLYSANISSGLWRMVTQ